MKLILLISLSLAVNFAISQNWTGAINSDWNNSANWSTWPLNNQDVTIDPVNYSGAGVDPIINSNSVFSPAQIIISNGGMLTINANLTTQDNVECIGLGSEIIVNSGVFSVAPGDGGRLIIDLEATCTINDGTVIVDERFIAGENTLVTINNGTTSSGERLIMDLGGQFIQDGGTVNVAAVFAMADGSLIQASGYTFNDGNLNISGEFGMECETGNFEPFFHQNGGVLTVNADMFWLGTAPGSGRGHFIQNNGTATINGIIQNMPASTMGMQFELHNSATCNITGTLFENLHATDSLIQTGNSLLNITQPNFALINYGVVNGISGNTVIDGNCTASATGSFQFNNLEIVTNGSLSHTTSSPISISGNFSHNGSYIHQNHQLILSGNNLQTISGTTVLNAFDLTIINTNQGVMLNNSVNVDGFLELIDGVIYTSALNLLSLTENATSSSGNLTSFVSGPMEKTGNTAFVFPTGKNGQWARIGISAPSTISDVFRAEYFNSGYSSLSPVNSPLTAISSIEYWNLEQTVGTSSVQVELFWEDASASAITDCNELSIGQWDGAAWINELSTTTGLCTGNNAGSITSVSTMSSFGNLTFGFYSGVTSQQFQLCPGGSVIVGTSTYNTTGTYIDVLQDISLNDSIVITSLTIIAVDPSINFIAPAFSAVDQAAGAYDWLDCNTSGSTGITSPDFTPTQSGWYALKITKTGCVDTSECMFYTLIDSSICQGEVVSIGSSNYAASGTYYDNLLAGNGNDSIVSLILIVNAVDTSFQINSNSLVSANTAASSFQWFDCVTAQPIINETTNTYNLTSNGSYALIVEENGCIDTSSCLTISNVGLDDELQQSTAVIYPNPAKNSVSIKGITNLTQVEFYTLTGQLVLKQQISENQVLSIDLPKGLYLVKTVDRHQNEHQFKLTVE